MASNAAEQPDQFTRPLGAARATAQMFDAMAAPLTRAIEQNEREIGVLREQRASEDRALAEQETHLARVISDASDATPTGSRVEIFDDSATVGLLAEFDAELRLDGYQTTVGVRRDATGHIRGVVIHVRRERSVYVDLQPGDGTRYEFVLLPLDGVTSGGGDLVGVPDWEPGRVMMTRLIGAGGL